MRNLLLLLAFSLTGCAFDHKKDGGDSAPTVSGIQRTVAYAQVYQSVIAPRCVGCHGVAGGNQGGVNLETFDSTFPLVARIQQATLVDHTMPKGGTLSSDESSLLAAWIGQGASRDGAANAGQASTLPVGWAAIREQVLAKSCLDCHSGPNPEKGLDLSTLEVVKANAAKIFDRAVIQGDMPLAPYPTLSVEEKQALARWIALGMPE